MFTLDHVNVSVTVVCCYYYYYAAFNAPCVGHKDDESHMSFVTNEAYLITADRFRLLAGKHC